MNYVPDCWVIVEIRKEGQPAFHKVVAGWSGGYLDGDAWRVNSGITKIEKKEDRYDIHGFSGSIYECRTDREGFRMALTSPIGLLSQAVKQENPPSEFDIISIEDILERYTPAHDPNATQV